MINTPSIKYYLIYNYLIYSFVYLFKHTFKQVYIYGALNRGPITLNRDFGFAWAVNGFLLFNALGKLGTETVVAMRKRVAEEITTTFASNYTHEVSLAEVLQLQSIANYAKQATGEKYLITPQA